MGIRRGEGQRPARRLVPQRARPGHPTGPDDRGDLTGSFPGTITVVHRGCSDFTLLVVTGPGRGRLVEVNAEGFFAPRFYADSDFLPWYERWLDFVLTGHRNLNWFADQMAGAEDQLVATLLDDDRPARRRVAAYVVEAETSAASSARSIPSVRAGS